MFSEKNVEVGAVDVDFTPDLGEGDEALVAIVLPCLWRNAKNFTCIFGLYPFAAGIIFVAAGYQVEI